jgi:hypothetical protein
MGVAAMQQRFKNPNRAAHQYILSSERAFVNVSSASKLVFFDIQVYNDSESFKFYMTGE